MAKKKSENYLDFIPVINPKNDWSEGEDGSREQEVEIFYRFIGKID